MIGHDSLAELLAHTREVLIADVDRRPDTTARTGDPWRDPPHRESDDLWQIVAALIRLGEIELASKLLREHPVPPPRTTRAHAARQRGADQAGNIAPGLVLAAYATLQRAAGPTAARLPPARLRNLERALHRWELAPFGHYRDAALQIHGRYCLGLLEPTHRREHERTATARLLALEAETWQPGRGHFRPLACNGAICTPSPADATLLEPLAFGMLLATGDRLTRHLSSTLAAAADGSTGRWRDTVPEPRTSALMLTAAAQLGDHEAMQIAFDELLPHRATHPGDAARICNAVLFAISGVRLAAGGGLDAKFVRITPWLPDGTPQIELRGVLAQQHTFDLRVSAASTAGTHPRDEPVAGDLTVTVTLPPDAARLLPVVIGNRQMQTVTEASSTRPARARLPGARR